MADTLEFRGISNPVIERFILPKRLSAAAQSGIGVPGGNTFDDAGDFGKREARVQEDMDMIGHEDISVQIVAAKLRAAPDGVFGIARNLRVSQPEGARFGGI